MSTEKKTPNCCPVCGRNIRIVPVTGKSFCPGVLVEYECVEDSTTDQSPRHRFYVDKEENS